MPTITPTTETPVRGVVIFTWANMLNGDVGAPVQAPHYPDKSFEVEGTFGAGGNARLRGTARRVSPVFGPALTDPQGNVLDLGTNKIEAVQEDVFHYSPAITAGDGTTILTVRLHCFVKA